MTSKIDQLETQTPILITKEKKMKKAPKTFTIKQIIKTTIIVIALLSLGAFAGIQIQSAINSHIESRVTEQVQVFTQAVE